MAKLKIMPSINHIPSILLVNTCQLQSSPLPHIIEANMYGACLNRRDIRYRTEVLVSRYLQTGLRIYVYRYTYIFVGSGYAHSTTSADPTKL